MKVTIFTLALSMAACGLATAQTTAAEPRIFAIPSDFDANGLPSQAAFESDVKQLLWILTVRRGCSYELEGMAYADALYDTIQRRFGKEEASRTLPVIMNKASEGAEAVDVWLAEDPSFCAKVKDQMHTVDLLAPEVIADRVQRFGPLRP